ncbi:hypothetical protein WK32_32825 [Burkholderia vietnamiensis]|nr:hypothetical protein WK32_32825 [Burkholderia vietnamiensis]
MRALAQHLALRSLLAALAEKCAHVPEVVDVRIIRECLACRQISSIAGEHVADLSLRHRHHRVNMHTVLERCEEMEPAAQQFGLEAGFARQRK